ncbi:MAG: WYL domain-containing protein, partial [Oscillospiraceae bacterium]
MAKSANYKRKLLILAKMLLERSDEEHPISRQEMQEELERWGLTAERKTLYDDMEQLQELGLDVQ